MTDPIKNRTDFGRCHCGGHYALPEPTPDEKSGGYIPSFCRDCHAFRYLNEKERDLALASNAQRFGVA